MPSELRRAPLVLLGLVGLLLVIGAAAARADGDTVQPIDYSRNVVGAPTPVAGVEWANGPSVKTGTAICTTPTQLGANVNTDCETNGPHNETAIAVNPTNPLNMIGGANDYQLSLNPGGHVGETVVSRAHVTFDGGKTWSEYPLYSNSTYQSTGDPALAFDSAGHAYYATLGFRFVGPTSAINPDVLVADSGDGGRTWSVKRIASGSGLSASVGELLDKEYVTAWGNGNALVTFGDFHLVQKGTIATGRIYSSVTHDSGKTWSQPTLISGSLDSSFVSVPTRTADGRIFVSFLNTTHFDPSTPDYGRDEYMVVELNPATGAPLTQPKSVGLVYDGTYDYPWALGSTTYQDSIFRTWAAGNITADPTNANHLAVVWSDMRNSSNFFPNASANPYAVTTNSDIVVTESTDGGAHWSAPTAIGLSGDQFMPWGAIDGAGRLRIGFFDRHYDAANHLYGYSVATEAVPGVFSTTQASTALSDPTRDNRWFARTLNAAFPRATAFLGDYSNIAVVPTGTGGFSTDVAAYWTDLREENCWALAPGCGRHGQDAYFAVVH